MALVRKPAGIYWVEVLTLTGTLTGLGKVQPPIVVRTVIQT